MPCYKPQTYYWADQAHSSLTAKPTPHGLQTVRCGGCPGCRLDYSRQWALRMAAEAVTSDASLFLTLTYDDAFLPERSSLCREHTTLFLDRFRKKTPLRYYLCGEYGDKTSRPHYHAIVFLTEAGEDYIRKDERVVRGGTNRLFSSPALEDLWDLGHVSYSETSFETNAYVARYILKKARGKTARSHYERVDESTGEIYNLEPEFSRKSQSLGRDFVREYSNEIFSPNSLPEVFLGGRLSRAPKAFLRFAEQTFSKEYTQSILMGKELGDFEFSRLTREDCTPRRLAARLHVQTLNQARIKRNFE